MKLKEMKDASETTSTALAVAETRAQKPGGCAGIFFQLFEWNRRFAKKKLFSGKLLPQARAKQASKIFGGNEKQPAVKPHLIADDNRGGFPCVKKSGVRGGCDEKRHKMQTPCLVARLMGLESLPAVQPRKVKGTSGPEIARDRIERLTTDHIGYNKVQSNLNQGQMKHETKQQKIQKMGQCERKTVTKFGAEALQLKGVLSRRRKHHHQWHPKRVSSVKSPRSLSGRNASRLIGAAAKILEPGLQARSRAKCALPCTNIRHSSPKDDPIKEERTYCSTPKLSTDSAYYGNAVMPLMGQSSSKNSNTLDAVECRLTTKEDRDTRRGSLPSAFARNITKETSLPNPVSATSKPRAALFSLNGERDALLQASPEQHICIARQTKDNAGICDKPSKNEMPLIRKGQEGWCLSNQQQNPSENELPSIHFRQTTETRYQKSLGRDRLLPNCNLNINLQHETTPLPLKAANRTKDYITLNRSLSSPSLSRMSAKVANGKIDSPKKFSKCRDHSLTQLRTPVRKRTINVDKPLESAHSVDPNFKSRRNVSCNAISQRGRGSNVCSISKACVKSRLSGQDGCNTTNRNKDSNAISFTFNSPIKQRCELSASSEREREGGYQDYLSESSTLQRKLINENGGKKSGQEQMLLCGDALGALLEQKMKEFFQQGDELATEGNAPKRSAAMTLQELICALTPEKSISLDNQVDCINSKKPCCSVQDLPGRIFKERAWQEAKQRDAAEALFGFSQNAAHLSPGSVLEASFTNESCISSSLDDNSGHKLHSDLTERHSHQLRPSEPDAELLDSATSLSIRPAGVTKHAKDIILNAEALFGTNNFPLCSSLWDELETHPGFKWTKQGVGQVRGLLFDCLAEYLESQFGRFSISGLETWRRLVNVDGFSLSREFLEEVRRWANLSRETVDEIIEWETRNSSVKWSDFGDEAFETGVEVDCEILQLLLEEIVGDFLESGTVI